MGKPNSEQDLWKHVSISNPSECWNWMGHTEQSGYGVMRVRQKHFKTHRLAYILTHGDIPDGMCVCHTCDNRKCCNPNHLWLGTNADNVKDRHSKGRSPRGEQSGRAKLTEEQVKEIRRLHAEGRGGYRTLAKLFKTPRDTIGAIIRRNSWKHI